MAEEDNATRATAAGPPRGPQAVHGWALTGTPDTGVLGSRTDVARLVAPLPRDPLARAYVQACLDELDALKPGNVSIHAPGHDMTAADFARSARASAPHLCNTGAALGRRILDAVIATREVAGCNTNLGIVLLCAPLLMAAGRSGTGQPLAPKLRSVLTGLTLADTAAVFEAIRVAAPAGLGRRADHDVNERPTAPLRTVMAAAADTDRIAHQYAHEFPDVLVLGPSLLNAAGKRLPGGPWRTVALYLGLLARIPDTHVRRKFGDDTAREVTAQAATLEKVLMRDGAVPETVARLQEFDAALKRGGINPGTTADLTVATLLAVRLG